jgi:hypothetical protein
MAYFLSCVHEFNDHKLGHISRGQLIHDKDEIARLYWEDNREHHFVKVEKPGDPEYWSWPPPKPVKEED